MIGALLAAILIHETGHALAASALGYSWRPTIVRWHGLPVGPAIQMVQPTRWDSAVIALAGPAANLVTGVAAWYLGGVSFGFLSVLLGLVSLVPLHGLDGWHVREALR